MSPVRRVSASESDESFGLIAWLESTRVVLPLKLVECRFQADGPFVHVEIDQVFHQSNPAPLDCRYVFPLPDGAAVHRCEMIVNGRVISARIEEIEAAREQYRSAKADGRRAALVEHERPNLFTLQLGNVQPGDLVVMRLAYVQTLERIAGELRLRVPVNPGVRYIPGRPLLRANSGSGDTDDTDEVPDASRISPPRLDAFHPDAAIFALSGSLAAADFAPGTLSSPTHPLLLRVEGERCHVALAESGAVPDRDLVVRWEETEVKALESRVLLLPAGKRTGRKRDYALVQLRPPTRALKNAAPADPADFYFLLDRSGSMEGLKWHRACAALRGFVERLNPADRVFLTLFESTHQDFSDRPMPAAKMREDAGFRALEQLGVAGGTELLPAARHLFDVQAKHSANRRVTLVLLTDGQVGNEFQILEAFAAQAELVVHTIGIDDAVNDSLLRRLALRHRGDCWLITPHDDIAGVVAALGARISQPVLRDLRLGDGAWEQADGSVPWPNVHTGQTREILLSAPAGTPPPKVTAEGRAVPLKLSRTGNDAVRLAWVHGRLDAFIAGEETARALALAKEHNVLCQGAAFVAWDEAERVAIAFDEIVQPSFAVAAAPRPATAMMPPMMPSPLPSQAGKFPPISRLKMPAMPPPLSSQAGKPKKAPTILRIPAAMPPLRGALAMFETIQSNAPTEARPGLPLGLADDQPHSKRHESLREYLVGAGLENVAATALAPTLLEWLDENFAAHSERLIDWCAALECSPRKLALCLDFLRNESFSETPAWSEAIRKISELRASQA